MEDSGGGGGGEGGEEERLRRMSHFGSLALLLWTGWRTWMWTQACAFSSTLGRKEQEPLSPPATPTCLPYPTPTPTPPPTTCPCLPPPPLPTCPHLPTPPRPLPATPCHPTTPAPSHLPAPFCLPPHRLCPGWTVLDQFPAPPHPTHPCLRSPYGFFSLYLITWHDGMDVPGGT